MAVIHFDKLFQRRLTLSKSVFILWRLDCAGEIYIYLLYMRNGPYPNPNRNPNSNPNTNPNRGQFLSGAIVSGYHLDGFYSAKDS